MSTEKRVNIGMIGAGWWPNTMHMPALATCDQANVVAVYALIIDYDNDSRLQHLWTMDEVAEKFKDYTFLMYSSHSYWKNHPAVEKFRLHRTEAGLPHYDLDCYVAGGQVIFTWRPLPA